MQKAFADGDARASAECFAGESQANRKYLAFARQAESEGNRQVAKVFLAAAAAEAVHAHAHMRAIGAVKSTKENLQEAINGESFEFQQMYPGYISEAHREGHKAALVSFQNAMAVEQVHHSLYIEALNVLGSGRDMRKRARVGPPDNPARPSEQLPGRIT
ncbi:MAG: rubrerythrin family protein [Phycisphaerales bacterium]|nr:MAG: rubrerythrin family protein [Phycisphaerales bacterium]